MPSVVLTDSTCDLSKEQAEVLGIKIIPLTIHFDGRHWLDHQELGSGEMFRRMQGGAAMPSSSPPSVTDYQDNLEFLLGQYRHVFAVHLSSRLSDTFAHATQAAAAFPGRVTVVDSWNSAGALAFQAERAARLLEHQTPPAKVKEVLEVVRTQAITRMCLNTLTHLRINGRIGGAKALLGGILNTKPIVGLKEGRVEPFGRAFGAQRAKKQMVALLNECAQVHPQARVAFFHNGNLEGVEELRHAARRLLLQTPLTLELGTVLSTHGGPDVYGFSFEPITVQCGLQAY